MLAWVLHKNDASDYENSRLLEEAAELGIRLRLVRPSDVDLLVTRKGRKSVRVGGEETPLPDVFLPRTGSGTHYFALAVCRHIERLGVLALNRADAIECVKDKLFCHQVLTSSNLPVPDTMLAKHPIDVDLVEQTIGFPCVVKPLTGSHGKGIFMADSKDGFSDVMEFISSSAPSANLIIQQFISAAPGRDLRVFVVGGRPIACMQRVATDGGFKTNYSRGAVVEPYEMTDEIEWLSTEASRAVGLDIAGVDLLFDEGGHFRICEVNSAPQFRGMESLKKVNVARQILKFCQIRLGAC